MAKYYGAVGYADTVETKPGVWTEVITEKKYYGDIIRISRSLQAGENLNDNITVNNQISIVADPFAYKNFNTIRYINWMGTLWKVDKVEVQSPRLILTIGGVYNGKSGPTSRIS